MRDFSVLSSRRTRHFLTTLRDWGWIIACFIGGIVAVGLFGWELR
jgi:hypothetical protein